MKTTIEMSRVSKCCATTCAYNKQSICHAVAITIGDGANPNCDTYFKSNSHCQREAVAGVGACKVVSCCNNNDYECQAEEVGIDLTNGRAVCTAYSLSKK